MNEEEQRAADTKGQGQEADLSLVIEKYSEILAQDPDSRVFAILAEAYRKSGNFQEAIKVAREGLEKHPHYMSGRVALARAYFDGDQIEEARQEFEKVVSAAPENLMAHRHLAEIYMNQGRLSDAAKSLKMIVLLDPNDEGAKEKLNSLAPPEEDLSEPAEEAPEMVIEGHRYEGAAPTLPEEEMPPQSEEFRPITDQEMIQEPDLVLDEEQEEPAAPVVIEAEEEPILPAEEELQPPAAIYLTDQPEPSVEEPPAEKEFAEEEPVGWDQVMDEVVPEEEIEEPKDELNTETLAEIYIQQGFYDKALAIYRKLLDRSPEDSRLEQKCEELQSLAGKTGPPVEDKARVEVEEATPEEAEEETELGEARPGMQAPDEEAVAEPSAVEEKTEARIPEDEVLSTLRRWLGKLRPEKEDES